MRHYHRNDYRDRRRRTDEPQRADRTTVWMLILLITALVLALSFGDAQGIVEDLLAF